MQWVFVSFLMVQSVEGGYQLTVAADRPGAIYSTGEQVCFIVTVQLDGKPVNDGGVSYVLSNDGTDILAQGDMVCTGEPLDVTGTLEQPGFLYLDVTYKSKDGQQVAGSGGAGLDPLKIRPALEAPDDFDAFWAAKKQRLAELAMNEQIIPVDSPDPAIEVFDVQLDCYGGPPARGYLARPKDVQPGTLPAILWVHGAHFLPSFLDQAVQGAKMELLSMDLNGHGFPNGKPNEFYEKHPIHSLPGKGYYDEVYTYPYYGCEDRETTYFLGMYLRLIRAMDYLKQRPEWDGKILIVCGHSQGGLQAIAAGGLDPQVTMVAAGIPAMCEVGGKVEGWPRFGWPDAEGKVNLRSVSAMRYYSATNFARRIKADAIYSVGFIDRVCRPTTVYAAYNSMQGEKQMVNVPNMPHAVWPQTNEAFTKAILEHIAKNK
jgi:cephalosporin-C deacetylase-like acetyl esterase